MSTEMIIGVLAFVVGLVFVFGAVFRKQAGWKINPMWSGVIGSILIVGGLAVGVMPMLDDYESSDTTIVVDSTTPTLTATFDVEIESGGTNITVEDGKATWAHNSTSTNTTDLLFTFSPNPPAGSTADDLASIYFKVDQYSSKQYNEYMYAEDGDDRLANWTAYRDTSLVFTNKTEKGQVTMLMTESGNATLNIKINEDWFGDSAWDDYGTRELTYTFHNNDGWSETFTLTVIKAD